jgi:hypothetical protein
LKAAGQSHSFPEAGGVGLFVVDAESGAGLLGQGSGPRAGSETPGGAAGHDTREVATALRTLDAHGHWGRYNAPEASATATPKQAVPDLEGIARDYRLVGIEHGARGPTALLLPTAGAENSAQAIRLRAGEALAEGVTLSEIGSDSVGFSTSAGTSTLQLYDGAQP